jgi:nitroimidazol reductase NimA-like FMN-containing flavoprotein (pyridoxamine 5'-phosphate oxidase superfamily)
MAVSPTMTRAEREAFLAGVHVGILSVEDPGRGPLTVPVWYSYAPGGTIDIVTGGTSRKARCLRAAGRCSLCVQTEEAPYRYVSVEGPVSATRSSVTADERRALSYRYLGPEFGELYLAATEADAAASVLFSMSPERWLSTDYAKQFGGGSSD